MKSTKSSPMSVCCSAFVLAIAACPFFAPASAQESRRGDSPAPATSPADPVGNLRAIAARLRADGQIQTAEAIERQLKDMPRVGTFELLSDQIAELRAQVNALFPLLGGHEHISFVNQMAAKEGKKVFDGAVARDPSLAANVAKVELLKTFDAASEPMRRHAGEPVPVEGSYSTKPLVGASGFMMLWGPYEPLDPGRYLIVYRFQFVGDIKGDRVCFLDVSHKAVTYSGRRPGAEATPARVWNEIAVPIDVPKSMSFEFRMWPEGNRVALDRIYVYRLTDKTDPGSRRPVSIMGAVVRPGFYIFPNDNASIDSVIKVAGGLNALAHPSQFVVWRRKGNDLKPVPAKGNSARQEIGIVAGDILWIPERNSPHLLEPSLNIPPRDPSAGRELMDLSSWYNAGLKGDWHGSEPDNDFASLPNGVQTFAGTEFDVRGLIQLRASDPGSAPYPRRVDGIRLGVPCRKLHLFGRLVARGTLVGSYVLHYADGDTVTVPLRLGENIIDWWASSGQLPQDGNTTVAWTGTNGHSTRGGQSIHLRRFTWPNPRPDVELKTLDFVGEGGTAGAFLIAVTAER